MKHTLSEYSLLILLCSYCHGLGLFPHTNWGVESSFLIGYHYLHLINTINYVNINHLVWVFGGPITKFNEMQIVTVNKNAGFYSQLVWGNNHGLHYCDITV